jgi:hypothetical protein
MGITMPQQNKFIPSETNVLVQGTAADGDPDKVKAPSIKNVTAQVDSGAPIPLQFKFKVKDFGTHVTYQGNIGVLEDGPHTIIVTSEFSLDTVVSDPVTVNVGWVGSWSELYTDNDQLMRLDLARNANGLLEVIGSTRNAISGIPGRPRPTEPGWAAGASCTPTTTS